MKIFRTHTDDPSLPCLPRDPPNSLLFVQAANVSRIVEVVMNHLVVACQLHFERRGIWITSFYDCTAATTMIRTTWAQSKHAHTREQKCLKPFKISPLPLRTLPLLTTKAALPAILCWVPRRILAHSIWNACNYKIGKTWWVYNIYNSIYIYNDIEAKEQRLIFIIAHSHPFVLNLMIPLAHVSLGIAPHIQSRLEPHGL